MIRKAYKYRIYPNKEQREYFAKVFGCVRFFYNKSLSDMDEKFKFQEVKAIFDAVNVKQATEAEISLYIDKCFEDIDHLHVDETKKTQVKTLIQQLKNRSK